MPTQFQFEPVVYLNWAIKLHGPITVLIEDLQKLALVCPGGLATNQKTCAARHRFDHTMETAYLTKTIGELPDGELSPLHWQALAIVGVNQAEVSGADLKLVWDYLPTILQVFRTIGATAKPNG